MVDFGVEDHHLPREGMFAVYELFGLWSAFVTVVSWMAIRPLLSAFDARLSVWN